MIDIDNIIARETSHLKTDCKAGCDWCCQQLVVLTCRADAEAIIDRCQQQMDSDDFNDFKKTVREQAAAINSMPHEQAESKRWPCPLLKDHQCSVYAIRPTACRSVFSSDSGCCKAMLRAHSFDKLSKRHQQIATEIGERAIGLQIKINDQRPVDGAFELRSLLAEILTERGE
jgi:Fe-S-cluster containining protein